MKERISITLDQNILRTLDEEIDGSVIKNRSHAIELNLRKCFQSKELHQAVILAGGNLLVDQEGRDKPPFLLDINGLTLLEHNLNLLIKFGVKEFIFPLSEHIETIVRGLIGDGEKLGVSIIYVREENNLGSAGVLRLVSEYITGPFVVCNTRELKEINLKELFNFHQKQKTLATMAVTSTSTPNRYGVVVLNGSLIYSFVEKPEGKSPTNLISAGLYIFDPEVIKLVPEGYARLELDVFPKLVTSEELAGFIFYGKWQDIKNEEDLALALSQW